MTDAVVPPVRVVVLFHGKDLQHVERLEAHLAPAVRVGRLHLWHHAKLIPGDNEKNRIGHEIARAHLILLFVSAEFNAYHHTSINEALEKAPTARIVPISVRPCSWNDTRFFGLKPIPPDGTPIVTTPDDERRFQDAAVEILRVVDAVREQDHGLMATVQSPWAVSALASVEAELYNITRQFNALAEAHTGRILVGVEDSTLSSQEKEALAAVRFLVQHLRAVLAMSPADPITLESLAATLYEASHQLSNSRSHKHAGVSIKTIVLALTALVLGMLTVLFVVVLLSKPSGR